MAALIRCGRLLCRNLGRSIRPQVISNTLQFTGHRDINLCISLDFVCSGRSYSNLAETRTPLPSNVRHLINNGFVSRHLYSSLLSSFERAKLTENNVLTLLYICCCGPYDAPINERVEMVDDIWSRLDEYGLQLTSKLYNMKLKAYLANKKKFSPLDELAAMKSLGLNPDKVTYGLLIEGFNQNGDVTGANYVLEAMKDAQLNIETATFNSFVTGHLKSGSVEEADNTVNVMRSRGLSPNIDTYLRYAEFYASEGDGDKVLEYIQKAKNETETMSQSMVMGLYSTMLLFGHATEANKIIPVITQDFFKMSSMNRLTHLISEGFSEEAFKLYMTLPKLTRPDTPGAGRFLLRAMIINYKDPESIVKMADNLLEFAQSSSPHNYAVYFAYRNHFTDQAISILKLLSAKNHKVKMAHLIPAVCQYRNAKNVEGLYEAVGMLMNTEITDPQDFVQTMSTFCLPALAQLGQTKKHIYANMKEQEKKWNSLFLIEDFSQGSWGEALDKAEEKQLDEKVLEYLRGRHSLHLKYLPERWEVCLKFLTRIKECNVPADRFLSSSIFTIIEQVDSETVRKVLDFAEEQKIRLQRRRNRKRLMALPEDVQTMLKSYFSNQAYPQPSERSKSKPPSMSEMESMALVDVENCSKKFPYYHLARIVLLRKHLEEKDLPSAQQRLRELDVSGFKLRRRELISLIPKLVDLGDVESALFYMKSLIELYGTDYPDYIALKLGVALLKSGNVQEALAMIQRASESQALLIDQRERIRKRMLTDIVSQAPTVEVATLIHKTLMDTKTYLSSSDTKIVHWQYVKKVLASDVDDEVVLQILEGLIKEYRIFPCIDEIMTRFIMKQKISDLKRVIDLGISVVGSSLLYHKLAFNLVGCGMPARASSVLQSMKDKIDEKAIIKSCHHFAKNEKVDYVESIVNITKTLPVRRGRLLGQLIEAYVNVDDMEKAIGALQKCLDEKVLPPKQALELMSVTLQTHNLDTPQALKTLLSQRAESQMTATEKQTKSSQSSGSSSPSSVQSKDRTDFAGSESESHMDVHSSPSNTDLLENKS